LRIRKIDETDYDSGLEKAKELVYEVRTEMEEWKYYIHAMIPTTPPHISPDTSSITNGNIWNKQAGGGYSSSSKMDDEF